MTAGWGDLLQAALLGTGAVCWAGLLVLTVSFVVPERIHARAYRRRLRHAAFVLPAYSLCPPDVGSLWVDRRGDVLVIRPGRTFEWLTHDRELLHGEDAAARPWPAGGWPHALTSSGRQWEVIG